MFLGCRLFSREGLQANMQHDINEPVQESDSLIVQERKYGTITATQQDLKRCFGCEEPVSVDAGRRLGGLS